MRKLWRQFVDWLLGPESDVPAYDPWDEAWF